MKLLVAGSRDINDFDICGYIDAGVDTIICGGARGIDTIAEQYADEHRLSKIVLRPRYDLYGRAAPIRRNEEMVDMADAVLVIWNGKSNGTKHTVEYAKRRGKDLTVIILD